MKRAFTLIELLVVIAIIAILAAILFPVFAQAKDAAKKTALISNVKQLATGAQIYLTDSDDTFPMAFSRRADGSWRYATVHPTPANVINVGGWDAADIVAQSQCQWANSLNPYIKNYDMYSGAAQQSATISGDTFTPGVKPADVGLTMNGLFHTWNASAVANPSLAVAFWSGLGNTALRGRSSANPSLYCGANTADCRFNPGGPTQAGGPGAGSNLSQFFGYGNFSGNYKIWTHGSTGVGGVVYVRADTSTKYQRAGTVQSPQFHGGAESDPYALWNNNGAGFSYWASSNTDCSNIQQDGTLPRYVCFFRPDREK